MISVLPNVEISSSFIGEMSLSFPTVDAYCSELCTFPYCSECSTMLYLVYYLSFMIDPRLLVVSRRRMFWMWVAASVG
jgi:hypothetical protein